MSTPLYSTIYLIIVIWISHASSYQGAGDRGTTYKAVITGNSVTLSSTQHNIDDDCCSFASGVTYDEITQCDLHKISHIETILYEEQCLSHCNPFNIYNSDQRNWNCITNYSLLTQYQHTCKGVINGSIWNQYVHQCPSCFNVSIAEYDSLCRSSNGREFIMDTYISENCECIDLTLFLVVIVLIISTMSILIGMLILWYRFNIYLVNQHLKQRAMEGMHHLIATEEEIPMEIDLNDLQSDEDDD